MTLSEPELQRVEATFRVTLPPGYRKVATRCARLPRGVDWLETADVLIATNAALLDDPDWDPAYFAIAETGSGDYYCLELDSPDVVLYSHEEREFHELGRFSDWITSPGATEEGSPTTVWSLLACFGVLLLLGLILLMPICFAIRASL